MTIPTLWFMGRFRAPPLPLLLSLLLALLLLSGCAGPPARVSGGDGALRPIGIDGGKRGDVVLTALGLVSSRYRYGGSAPETGFDCSGLVAYVFDSAADTRLPHNAAEIARYSRPIPRSRLDAGDFVFFNTLGRSFSHVGIYIGDGKFVNAPSSGGQVRIDTLANPYFAKRFEGARTLFRS